VVCTTVRLDCVLGTCPRCATWFETSLFLFLKVMQSKPLTRPCAWFDVQLWLLDNILFYLFAAREDRVALTLYGDEAPCSDMTSKKLTVCHMMLFHAYLHCSGFSLPVEFYSFERVRIQSDCWSSSVRFGSSRCVENCSGKWLWWCFF
jgi:hypothetical protein